MAKKVYKYGTGAEIPQDAIYLSTQVETRSEYDHHDNRLLEKRTQNMFVWHYFLVEVQESTDRPDLREIPF